jgi:3D (Asp-Asp-Asp) domain-containing protein
LRKIVIAVLLPITVIFFGASSNLVDASYEKPKPPLSLPGTIKHEPQWKVVKRLNVYVTAYYGPRRGQSKYAHGSFKKDVRINGAGKETRSGKFPEIGFAAADWKVLKKGTKFRILSCNVLLGQETPKPVSDMIFTVEDTGGGVKGKHVDIFTGFGDAGCVIAAKFDCRRYAVEVVECAQSH